MGLALAAVAAFGAYWWWTHGDDAAIRRRFDQLVEAANTPPGGTLDAVSRAARIGAAFTDDVVIDLGLGTAPIKGRGLVIEMAARLESRTTQFRVELNDVTVTLTGPDSADVGLTATFHPRRPTDDPLDAREFAATMRKQDGEWRIARAEAVAPLRRE